MPDNPNGISPEKILSFANLIATYANFFLKFKLGQHQVNL